MKSLINWQRVRQNLEAKEACREVEEGIWYPVVIVRNQEGKEKELCLYPYPFRSLDAAIAYIESLDPAEWLRQSRIGESSG